MNWLKIEIIGNLWNIKNTLRKLISESASTIISLLPEKFSICYLENEEREKLELIKLYLEKKPNFFKNFIKKNPELLNWNYIEEKLKYYVKDFLEVIKPTLKDSYLEYEKIVNSDLEILYSEWLFRTKKDCIKYFEILDIYTKLWKSIEIAYIVMEILISDIKSWRIDAPASINVEVSDFSNPEFVNKFESLIDYYELEIKENMIIFEILENQIIIDNKAFKENLERINKMWISIAIDDIMKVWSHLEDINEIKTILETHKWIKIIKICWKYLQKLYTEYSNWNYDNCIKVTEFIVELRNEWFYVIWEWVETKEHLMFAKNILGVWYFQWFYFNQKDN